MISKKLEKDEKAKSCIYMSSRQKWKLFAVALVRF